MTTDGVAAIIGKNKFVNTETLLYNNVLLWLSRGHVFNKFASYLEAIKKFLNKIQNFKISELKDENWL